MKSLRRIGQSGHFAPLENVLWASHSVRETGVVKNITASLVRRKISLMRVVKVIALVILCLVLLNIFVFRSKPQVRRSRSSLEDLIAADSPKTSKKRQPGSVHARRFRWCRHSGGLDIQTPALPAHNTLRLRHLSSTCNAKHDGQVSSLTSQQCARTSYCVVPKASCTYWLSLFHFLSPSPATRQYDHPFRIPRATVHQQLHVLHTKRLGANDTMSAMLNDTFRFMFVRNPYSRLWSAYIDKLFLLDFWPVEGKTITQFLNSTRGRQLLGYGRSFSKCFSDISFAEFATFVAGSGEKLPRAMNEHWRPLEHVCDPCRFNPHLVGHVETFTEDSLPVLSRLNLTWVLDSYNHQLHQMEQVLENNFQELKNNGGTRRSTKFYKSCTNSTEVAQRLWAAFQMYGYLPESYPFPSKTLGENITAKRFKELLFQTYNGMPQDVRRTLRDQRKRAMQKDYATLSMEVLNKLASLYQFEFAAFDYEMRPPELFEQNKYR